MRRGDGNSSSSSSSEAGVSSRGNSSKQQSKNEDEDGNDGNRGVLQYLIPLCEQLERQNAKSELFSVLIFSIMLHGKFVPYEPEEMETDKLKKIELKLPNTWMKDSPDKYTCKFYPVGYFNNFFNLIVTNNDDETMLVNFMNLGTDEVFTTFCIVDSYVKNPNSPSMEKKFSHINDLIKEFNDNIITPALKDLKNIKKVQNVVGMHNLFEYIYPLVEQLNCKDSEPDLFFILVFAIFRDNGFCQFTPDEEMPEISKNESAMDVDCMANSPEKFSRQFFPKEYCNYRFELMITNLCGNMILNFYQLDRDKIYNMVLNSNEYVPNPNAASIEKKYSNLSKVADEVKKTLIDPGIKDMLKTENLVSDKTDNHRSIFKYLIPLCKQLKRIDSKTELFKALLLAVMFDNNFRVFESENNSNTISLPESWKLNDENQYSSDFYPIGYKCKCHVDILFPDEETAVITFLNIKTSETYGIVFEIGTYVPKPDASSIEMKFSHIKKAMVTFKNKVLTPGRSSLLSSIGVASASLVGLPSELLTKIMLFIGGVNTLNLAKTCRRLRLQANDNSLWEILFKSKYPREYEIIIVARTSREREKEYQLTKTSLKNLESQLKSGKIEHESEKLEIEEEKKNLECILELLESENTIIDWRKNFIECYLKNQKKQPYKDPKPRPRPRYYPQHQPQFYNYNENDDDNLGNNYEIFDNDVVLRPNRPVVDKLFQRRANLPIFNCSLGAEHDKSFEK